MTDQSVQKPQRKTAAAAAKPGRASGRRRDRTLVAKRREQLLSAATTAFAQDGYHDTDLQQIVDSLHLGKGTLYRYFDSKRALFLAAVDRGVKLLHNEIEAARNSASDPLDQISEAIKAYLAFFDSRPEFVELLILERAVFKDRTKPTYVEYRERNIGTWHQLWAELIAAKRVRPIEPDTITDVLSSALYGTMFTNYYAGRRKSLEQQAVQITNVVFEGILTDSEKVRRKR